MSMSLRCAVVRPPCVRRVSEAPTSRNASAAFLRSIGGPSSAPATGSQSSAEPQEASEWATGRAGGRGGVARFRSKRANFCVREIPPNCSRAAECDVAAAAAAAGHGARLPDNPRAESAIRDSHLPSVRTAAPPPPPHRTSGSSSSRPRLSPSPHAAALRLHRPPPPHCHCDIVAHTPSPARRRRNARRLDIPPSIHARPARPSGSLQHGAHAPQAQRRKGEGAEMARPGLVRAGMTAPSP